MNHDMTSRTPSALIDDLIVHWLCWNEYESFYLCKLAPNLVANPESGDETEKKILRQLRPLLSEDEWNNLPSLIAERRAGNLREIEYERLRREAEEKKRQEIERERICRENQKRELLIKIDKILEQDFLSAEGFFSTLPSGIISNEEFESKKVAFVHQWFADQFAGPGNLPDSEQLAAIADVNGHVQVVARAGSGKTATLVNRTFFSCGTAMLIRAI